MSMRDTEALHEEGLQLNSVKCGLSIDVQEDECNEEGEAVEPTEIYVMEGSTPRRNQFSLAF